MRVILGIASEGLKMAGEKGIIIMKAEHVLKWMTAAAGHLKNGDDRNAAEIIEAMKEEAAAEIRREEAKNGGKLSRMKAAERVIKSAKCYQPARECLHGAWIDSDDLQCICDGFSAYRLREHLPLEKIPERAEPIDAKRIVAPNQGEPLTLPDLGELRAYIKTEKARLKAKKDKSAPVYDFGEGLPAVNAEYLLNALELLPGCTATASKERPEIRTIYFKSEAGEGVICPVRKGATV